MAAGQSRCAIWSERRCGNAPIGSSLEKSGAPRRLDLLMALNAGCSGMATIHANSARDALEKLVSYSVLAGQNIAIPFVRRAVASITDIVVYLRRAGRRRHVDEIIHVPSQLDGEVFTVSTPLSSHGRSTGVDGHRPNDERLDPDRWIR